MLTPVRTHARKIMKETQSCVFGGTAYASKINIMRLFEEKDTENTCDIEDK
jgi:hypothetical protein